MARFEFKSSGSFTSGNNEVVKNLVIINAIVYLATVLYPGLTAKLGLYYPSSEYFKPYQVVTYMFTHGGFFHIFFNMYSLWAFGSILERLWGPKRFLLYYLFTGFGAIILHEAVNAFIVFKATGGFSLSLDQIYNNQLAMVYHVPAVGASGAIFGTLIAFGMLFPNTQLMLLLPPVPVKAKYLVPILVIVELTLGIGSFRWDNIAHFAHLGGALFGFLLIKFWNRKRNDFY